MHIAILKNPSVTSIDLDIEQVAQVNIGKGDICNLSLKDGSQYEISSKDAEKIVNAVLHAK